MEICFVLPQILRHPVGGYKMVYEYSNHLIDEGYTVKILFINDNALEKYNFPNKLRKVLVNLITLYEPRWFNLNKKVIKISTTESNITSKLQSVDLAIATGLDTLATTETLFTFTQKVIFIQGHENWVFPEEELERIYGSDIDKIVVSNWLKEIVDKYSPNKSILIKNPIDTQIYKKIIDINNRYRHSIGVLYHDAENKGFRYSYEAILRLKVEYPDLVVKMFGTTSPSFELPKWIDFTLNASQIQTVQIYNSVSVFICSTINEGFGLTGLESMACGAVLVSSNYEGVNEYAIDGYNALLSPTRDVKTLIQNVVQVFENDDLKKRLSYNGIKQAKTLNWDGAMKKINAYIETEIKNKKALTE